MTMVERNILRRRASATTPAVLGRKQGGRLRRAGWMSTAFVVVSCGLSSGA